MEIEDETADIKIEIGDNEQEFTLETTDKEVILSEIASRLGVTVEQIRDIVEFELKEKEKIIEEEEQEEKENDKGDKKKSGKDDKPDSDDEKGDEDKSGKESKSGSDDKEDVE